MITVRKGPLPAPCADCGVVIEWPSPRLCRGPRGQALRQLPHALRRRRLLRGVLRVSGVRGEPRLGRFNSPGP
jgi:hypothetical protein